MPPKKGKGDRRAPPATGAAAEASAAPKKEDRLNLGDSAALKRALDDAVVEVVQAEGWTLDYSLADLKIGLGLLSIAVACFGQFFPKHHPLHTAVLVGCVAVYALLSVGFTALASLVERDIIALTKAGPGGAAPPRIALASRLPRFNDAYTLRAWPRGGGGSAAPGTGGGGGGGGAAPAPPLLPGELRLSKSVAACFTQDGFLVAEAIKTDAQRLLRQLAGGESAKDR
eukprot:scaffold5.g767.t1